MPEGVAWREDVLRCRGSSSGKLWGSPFSLLCCSFVGAFGECLWAALAVVARAVMAVVGAEVLAALACSAVMIPHTRVLEAMGSITAESRLCCLRCRAGEGQKRSVVCCVLGAACASSFSFYSKAGVFGECLWDVLGVSGLWEVIHGVLVATWVVMAPVGAEVLAALACSTVMIPHTRVLEAMGSIMVVSVGVAALKCRLVSEAV